MVHRMKQRFGFRTIEVRDGDGIYVNDCRVVLKVPIAIPSGRTPGGV